MVNPIKAGGSESLYRLGASHPPPLEKGLREYVKGWNACSFGKKIRPITLIV